MGLISQESQRKDQMLLLVMEKNILNRQHIRRKYIDQKWLKREILKLKKEVAVPFLLPILINPQ